MRKPIVIAVSLLLVAVLAAVVWLIAKQSSSGWLCCITDPASGGTICVSVKGIDSECAGGTVGWCDDYTEDPSGEAHCHDK